MTGSTDTPNTLSPVGRGKVKALAPVVGFALVAVLVLAGCTSDYDALRAKADKRARNEMASYHVAMIACMQRNLRAGVYVNDPDVPDSIRGCFDWLTYGAAGSALNSAGSVVEEGTSLRSVDRDPNDMDIRRIVAIDVGVAVEDKLYSSVSVAYVQCWSSTINMRVGTMTTPASEQCTADLLGTLDGGAEQLDMLLTVAPDGGTGG